MAFVAIDTNLSRKVFKVTDYFITKNAEQNKGLTNKKLQKLLYYSQAWSWVLFNKPLFDEPIQAWVHGPAIPRVYGVFKEYVMDDITEPVAQNITDPLSAEEESFLEEIWNLYGGFDAGYLEALTHQEEPWQKARRGVQPYEAATVEITSDDMKAYYVKRLEETEKSI